MGTPSNDPFVGRFIKQESSTPRQPRSTLELTSTPFSSQPVLQYSFSTSLDADLSSPPAEGPAVQYTTLPATSQTGNAMFSASHPTSTESTVDVPTQAMYDRLARNDTAFTPKPFRGVAVDSDGTEQWLDYFQTYTAYKEIREESKIQLFKLLLVDQAADWLRSLEPDVTDDFASLLRAFRRRYSITDIDRWRKATLIWQRDQQPLESVDTFVTAIQNAARIVPIHDATLIRFAIIRGLKPAIRLHVLQTGATTLDDVIRAARVAEAALSASGPTDEVSQLTAQVTQLLAKLATKPAVAVVDDTDARRRVTFTPTDGIEEGRRSPTTSPMSPYRTRSPVDTQLQRPTHQTGPSYNRSAPPTRR